MRTRMLLFVLCLPLLSCWEGATLDENEAGQDTYLEGSGWKQTEEGGAAFDGLCAFTGAIAVDHRTDSAYVLQTVAREDCAAYDPWRGRADDRKSLYAVRHDRSAPRYVTDLSGYDDIRILFPHDALLVMAESGGRDELLRIDPASGRVLQRVQTNARYHGTRLSPSRRFVAVADNADPAAPIHVIDAEKLTTLVVPHGGDWLEAMWLKGSDRLFVAAFDNWLQGRPRARLMMWSFEDMAPGSDPWAEPELDIVIDDADFDMFFSFTWVGVAPDDQTVVVPIVRRSDGEYWSAGERSLAVVDIPSGTVRFVPHARGPVAFTPDGSTIVSFEYETGENEPDGEAQGGSRLLFIDRKSLDIESAHVPIGDPEFFVTRDGSYVLVASSLGWDALVLYDYDRDEVVRLGGPRLELREFVSRPGAGELWLVDDGLFRLDLYEGALKRIPLGWTPDHINRLPGADLLVLDDLSEPRIRFFSPEDLTTARAVPLPTH